MNAKKKTRKKASPKVAKKSSAKTKSTGPKPQPLEAEVVDADEIIDDMGIPGSDAGSDFKTDATEIDEFAAKDGMLPALMPKSVPSNTRSDQPVDGNFRQYLTDISRYPVIDPDKQIELAKELARTGNMNIAKALVTTNLRLVVKIAMEYRSSYENIMDLIQEGNVGLMKAVSNYDPYKGTRLSYYASWWIRSYILKFLLDNFRLIKIGTTQAQKKLFYNLVREKERLAAQGIEYEPKLLAEKLDVREKDVREMNLRLSSSGSEVSIDKPVTTNSGESISTNDYLVDSAEAIDEQIAENQLRGMLQDKIGEFQATLNEKERTVFVERLISENPKTLQEVADIFGFSRERARQIEVKVIEKLKKHMAGYFDDLES